MLLQITTLALNLLKSNECSSYAADLLLFLVTLYAETILSDSLFDSLIQVYSVLFLVFSSCRIHNLFHILKSNLQK